jgi:hypothetical protein
VLPVVGGVGGVGVMAVVAFLMMGKSGQAPTGADTTAQQETTQQLVAAPRDTGQTSQQARPTPGNIATNVPAPRPGPGTTQTQTTPPPGPQPAPVPAGGANVEDSLAAAVSADQSGRPVEARRLARWVYTRDQATREQKATAAELVATTYEDDPTSACEWIRNALNYATGAQRGRVQNMFNTYQCQQ